MTLPTPETPLKIGTRGSPLALAQAEETRDRLAAAHGLRQAEPRRDATASKMTPEQLAQAERLALEWEKRDSPSARH